MRASATRGLGDKLVSGAIDADEWLVTHEHGRTMMLGVENRGLRMAEAAAGRVCHLEDGAASLITTDRFRACKKRERNAMRMVKRYGHIGQSAQRDALRLLDPAPTKQDDDGTDATVQ